MANLSKTTQDHDEIRRWAEERGGKPSHVKKTGSGEDVGILRIDFPGYSGEGSLEQITWDEWFDKFDEGNLALLYEEETAGGAQSNFNKIVKAETAAANERGRGGSRTRKGGSTRAKKSAPPKKASAGKKSAKSAARGGSNVSGRAATKKKKVVASKKASKTASKKSSGRSSRATKSASRGASKKSAAKKSSAKRRR